MDWIMWVGSGLVVLLLIALIVPSRKTSTPPEPNGPVTTEEMSETRGKQERVHDTPTLDDLSSGLQTSLRTVAAAVERCRSAHGDDMVDAWRGLHLAMGMSVATLRGLLGETPSPRLERMVALTSAEIWDLAEPCLVAHVPTTADDMAVLRRSLWDRAHAARANLSETRGGRAAHDRLRALADQVDAGVDALGGGTEDDRRTAAELRRFVNLAIG